MATVGTIVPMSHLAPTPDAELNQVLQALVEGQRAALGDNLVGVYLQGSFAGGGWDAYSDVDWIAAIRRPLGKNQVAALQRLHAALHALDCPWAQHLEGSYFPVELLHREDPLRQALWYLDNGSRELVPSNHCNTLVVRWQVREQGITLVGPPPAELIEPVSAEALRREVRTTMHEWAETFLGAPERISTRWYQPFVVLSYCRMLHTLATGRVHSKPEGVRWAASGALHPRWNGLIRRAWEERPEPWRKVHLLAEPCEVELTLAFVRHALQLADANALAQLPEVTLVQPYDPAWPRWFETLRAYLAPGLAGLACAIEHTGSTAIPGMVAKPIVDVIIAIAPGSFPSVAARLLRLGYRPRGDLGIEGRQAFELMDAGALVALPAHHLYVCEHGAQELRKQLAFRDFMRGHPCWRERLSRLKWELCVAHANDRQAYIAGKDALVREITALALAEAGEDGR